MYLRFGYTMQQSKRKENAYFLYSSLIDLSSYYEN